MAIVYKDRAKEATTDSGLGNYYELTGAVDGFATLPASGNFYYCIETADGLYWEVGRGNADSVPGSLFRSLVLSSSSGGDKVNFPAGVKQVSCVIPAQAMSGIESSLEASIRVGRYGFTSAVTGTSDVAITNMDSACGIRFAACTYTVVANNESAGLYRVWNGDIQVVSDAITLSTKNVVYSNPGALTLDIAISYDGGVVITCTNDGSLGDVTWSVETTVSAFLPSGC